MGICFEVVEGFGAADDVVDEFEVAVDDAARRLGGAAVE